MERHELYNVIKHKTNIDIARIPTYEDKMRDFFYSEDLAVLNALGKFIKNALKNASLLSTMYYHHTMCIMV